VFDRVIVISWFGFQEAVQAQPEQKLWSEFVAEMQSGHEITDPAVKPWTWQFNLTEFKHGGRRRNSDARMSYGLVIDYDENVTIAEALGRFGKQLGLEFVLFTSFNHQRKKSADDYQRDKFRVVLPFKEPMPAKSYAQYGPHLTEVFAPGCDKRLAVVSQLYAFLYCPKETQHLAQVIHHAGSPLDWRDWPVAGKVAKSTSLPKKAAGSPPLDRSDRWLEPRDLVRTKANQWIAVEEMQGHISDLYCPFHDDKSPGAFAKRMPDGRIFLHCHKCGTAFMRTPAGGSSSAMSTGMKVDPSVSMTAAAPSETVEEPYDRARRERLLIKTCIRGWETGTLLLYAFEGFGKSRLCPLLAQVDQLDVDEKVKKRYRLAGQERVCVVFATKSNKQADEQAEGFRIQVASMAAEGGRAARVQLITGRAYNLKQLFAVDAVMDDGTHPWDAGDVNRKKTLAEIQKKLDCDDQRAIEIWERTDAAEPDFEHHEIIVTTHERVRAWGRIQDQSTREWDGKRDTKNRKFPYGVIVFFDDPGRSDFMLLAPYNEKFVKTRVDGKPLEQVQIGDYHYLIRPKLFHLDSGLYDTKLIFTTTEMVTRKLVEKHYPDVYVPELMPANKMKAGEIAVISTNCVHASRDGLMLALVHALKRDGFDVTLIGDGMGAQWNHQTNKGVNSFDTDLLIEVSFPTPAETTLLANELYGSTQDLRTVQVAIALDKMHQAIGRVGGYRFSDRPEEKRHRCVVLCDPKMRDDLVQQTRYFISHTEYADGWRDGGLKKPDDLYGLVSWYLRNVPRWITERDGRYFLSDVHKAIGTARDLRRIDRLLKALKTHREDITQKDGTATHPKAVEILEESIAWLESQREMEPKSGVSAA
jgi:hypothetical protein